MTDTIEQAERLRALVPQKPRDEWNAFDDAEYFIAIAQAGPDLIAQAERAKLLEAALAVMIYETTHLSPMEDDGSHWCSISASALANARHALSQTGDTL